MKRVATILVAILAAILVSTAVAAPAQATFTQCPSGTGCVWLEPNGFGNPLVLSVGANGVNTCHNFSGTYNNVISSVLDSYGSYAGHKLDLQMYSTSNCSTSGAVLLWVPPADFGQWSFDVSPYTFYNNVMSSFMIGYRD